MNFRTFFHIIFWMSWFYFNKFIFQVRSFTLSSAGACNYTEEWAIASKGHFVFVFSDFKYILLAMPVTIRLTWVLFMWKMSGLRHTMKPLTCYRRLFGLIFSDSSCVFCYLINQGSSLLERCADCLIKSRVINCKVIDQKLFIFDTFIKFLTKNHGWWNC